MAGQGKISARQKMINLMYLVFIAIMAMTVAPEVLSAFGLMEEKFDLMSDLFLAKSFGGPVEKTTESVPRHM